jgi:hypothetical protein
MATEPIQVRPLDLALAAEVRAEIARHRPDGVTVSSVAQDISMRRATFTERYLGRRPFSPGELAAVASALGLRASDLFARAEASLAGAEPPVTEDVPSRRTSTAA